MVVGQVGKSAAVNRRWPLAGIVLSAMFSLCGGACGSAASTATSTRICETKVPFLQTTPYEFDEHLGDRQGCTKFGANDHVSKTVGTTLPDASGVQHVVVILRENRSFDHYLGCDANPQVDVAPPTAHNFDTSTQQDVFRFHETRYCTRSTSHEWTDVHLQLDNGLLDGFVTASNDQGNGYSGGSRAMGFYDAEDIPYYYWLADTFAISDKYFAAVPGPTHPNISFYFHATACGFTEGIQDSADLLHNISTDCGLTAPSIFGLLDAASPPVSNHVYSYSNSPYRDVAAASRLLGGYTGSVDSIDQFKSDVESGNLAQVVFVESSYSPSEHDGIENDEHPPTDIQLGQQFSYEIVEALMGSTLWPSTVVFITWDEHGGYYDHVIPPLACKPDDLQSDVLDFQFDHDGLRVPLLVVSPFAKRQYVSHAAADHTSITRFIEFRWDLPALTRRDANAWPLLDLFQFDSPNLDVPTHSAPPMQVDPVASCTLADPPTGMPANPSSACRP